MTVTTITTTKNAKQIESKWQKISSAKVMIKSMTNALFIYLLSSNFLYIFFFLPPPSLSLSFFLSFFVGRVLQSQYGKSDLFPTAGPQKATTGLRRRRWVGGSGPAQWAVGPAEKKDRYSESQRTRNNPVSTVAGIPHHRSTSSL